MAEDRDIIEAHAKSTRHRVEVLKAERCGCFYCCEQFSPSEITDWVDPASHDMEVGTTAPCPKCGIDSVIPMDAGIDAEFLRRMKRHWF